MTSTAASPRPPVCASVSRVPSVSRARAFVGALALLGLLLWGGLTGIAWARAPHPSSVGLRGAWGGSLLSPFDAQWPSAAPIAPAAPGSRGSQPGTPGVTGAAGALYAPACTNAGIQAAGSHVVVAAGEWVCGDITVYGAAVTVLGRVSGSVLVVNGAITVLGEVDGNATTVGGDIHLLGRGRVLGKASALGGQVYAANALSLSAPASGPASWYSTVMAQLLAPDLSSLWLSLLFWACASLGFATMLPQQLGQTRAMVRRRLAASLLFGLLVAALSALASVVLVVTCLGVPLALLLGLVVLVAWTLGTLAVGAWLGERLFRLFRLRRFATLLPTTLIGTLLLAALKAIPYVGLVFGVVIGCVGLGAATLTLLSARRTTPPGARRMPPGARNLPQIAAPPVPQNVRARP